MFVWPAQLPEGDVTHLFVALSEQVALLSQL